ncbi:TOBE domain-containing protein [Methyloceanibacter sp.]|uniref:TOBE domain-containing protein n=1 Tax=Methyloceanibacter sp. TaxID=1965321 RepID=UPI00351B557B
MSARRSQLAKSETPAFATTLNARVLRHDPEHGLSTLFFGDGELRVPLVDAAIDSGVKVTIFARDVSIALSRPMDVSITNRLPGTILAVEPQAIPYVRVVFNLGVTQLDALVTTESVERLGLEPGLRAWAMIKSVAIGKDAVEADLPQLAAGPCYKRRIERRREFGQCLRACAPRPPFHGAVKRDEPLAEIGKLRPPPRRPGNRTLM